MGIIAEDSSDVEVLKILVRQLAGRRLTTSHFVGKGCGPLTRKTPGWCRAFEKKGCSAIALVHDLDNEDPEILRRTLETAISGARARDRAVIIPTRELEAWLLADTSAITRALGLTKSPRVIHHPESLLAPKERLSALVRACSKDRGKRYVNTVHNKVIAEAIDVRAIAARCP